MMKKSIALAIALILCLSAVMCGCTPRYDTSPDMVEGIRWITYDYSFCIKPAEDCTGFYKYNDKKYDIKVTFEGSRLTAVDTGNSNKELFNADWIYENSDTGKQLLYIYNIKFNKDDYEEFKSNFAEYVNLKQEKLEQSASE